MATKKPKISETTTNRRNPSQVRSREKVEKILLAVKYLIEKNGVASLKIGDIAKKAGVSPSSIYQYFSDKETIIIALAEHYMEQIRTLIEQNLQVLEGHAQISDVIHKNFVDIYELHHKEPALREIWFESVDPKLNQLAFEDTQRNANMILQRIDKYIDESKKEAAGEFVLLVTTQFAATLRLGIAYGEEQGRHFIDMHANMVANCLKEYIGTEAF
ncbi:TetR/AcrR family transcriptional regulator [Vibrio sp. JC009]|uniref:TetR/AcrR family transcriptional regulator n=1 Tax=Vibrio sp. JC009 TaxID=2912314 RepID=UPI0023B131BD|nr:TetR/AcrR family transcriptional regulator [Vibrio sp. JC009]WED24773.1 TetR/AcrR family transcriptional regulator [Vibrio sp. JC009]